MKWSVLIDLSGTLHVESMPTTGAVAALNKLRTSSVNVKFVTNTTKESRNFLYQRLKDIGFSIEKEEIHTSLSAARRYIDEARLHPYLLLEDAAMEDFEGVPSSGPYDSVVVGLAPSKFDYTHINAAFNVLLANRSAPLIAIHKGRYYKTKVGFELGPGPFAAALEFAVDKKALVMGKPEASFFKSGITEFQDFSPEHSFMIGDDVRDDIGGAQALGMKGILVKTGKYRDGDEQAITPPPFACVENFAAAVEMILEHIK